MSISTFIRQGLRLCGASMLVLVFSTTGLAQTGGSEGASEVIEEIITTGTYIRGSDTTGALPITVIDRNDLEDLGAPTTVDIVNNLVINTGSENRSNALGGQNRNTGTANINLRGLGLDKTLVLFNGKRQTIHATSTGDGSSFVDINLIPGIALERIEVLKDGAAATYGSDAVAGVVNFITRKNFDGLEVSGSYRARTDSPSADEWDVSGIWGWSSAKSEFVVAGAYTQVSRLAGDEVDWTTEQLDANRAVSSLAAPGAFIPLANPTTGFFAGAPLAGLPLIANDATSPAPNCGPNGIVFNALGTTANLGTPAFVGRCGYSFREHYNLQDDQEKINLWATFATDIGQSSEFYAEAAYYDVQVDNIGNSPSFPVLRFEVVPAAHPANPHGVPGIFLGRPFGQNFPTMPSWRDYQTTRLVGGFRGDFGGAWDYDMSLSYSSNNVKESSPTVLQQRFSDGLDGLGGPNCNTATGTPGVGDCQWFNPFSTRFTNPALANDPAVEQFMRSSNDLDQTADLLVFDAVFTRELWDMAAGTVSGAFGVQYRDESLDVKRNPEALIPNNFIFVGGGIEIDESQDVYAVFGELAIPLADSLEAQVALRYEDYGSQVGDTVDPKLALRWTVNDQVGIRASASTTFRGPALHQRYNSETNLIPFADVPKGGGTPATGFKGAETVGNPDLQPESATTFNIGLVLTDIGNFGMTLDYWNIDFEDVIAIENAQTKVSIENALCVNRTPDCRDPDIIRNPLPGEDPADNLQHSGEISKVIARFINAPTVQTSGVDLNATLGWDTASAGEWMLGLDYSYMIEYEIGGIPGVVGGQVTNVTIDAVGSRNEQNIATSMPQWRANAWLDWRTQQHIVKLMMRHIDEYTDDKTVAQTFNQTIDSWTTYDLYYTYLFSNDRTSMHLNFTNLTDEDPPFADQDLNFDARIHNPFGRQYQLVFRHDFGL
ncbi:MAG: TonB-dependent receptor [Gammaproteobacteria bacterium]|nr:TonB-dependent receptor [Gammaproteobacteria bacterium]